MKKATRQAIIDLKRVKEQTEITCQKIYDICEKNGESVGMTTIRKVFAPGSEDKTNDFRPDTLNAILHALIGTGSASLSKAENDALKAVIEMNDRIISEKDETIQRLTRELEDIRIRLDSVTDLFKLAMESLGRGPVVK